MHIALYYEYFALCIKNNLDCLWLKSPRYEIVLGKVKLLGLAVGSYVVRLLANCLSMQLIALIQEGSDSDEGPAWMEDEDEEESLAQVAVPSQKDIEEMLIRRRKKVGGSLRCLSCPLLAMRIL